jgi:hypothetical protein
LSAAISTRCVWVTSYLLVCKVAPFGPYPACRDLPIPLPSESGDRHNGHVPEFMELTLDDGAAIRLEVAPVGEPRTDLPDAFGEVEPVARGRASELAVETLRVALRPLGTVLQEIHDAVATTADRRTN